MPGKKVDHTIDYILMAVGAVFLAIGVYLHINGQSATGPNLADRFGRHFGIVAQYPLWLFFLLGSCLILGGLYFIIFPPKEGRAKRKSKRKNR